MSQPEISPVIDSPTDEKNIYSYGKADKIEPYDRIQIVAATDAKAAARGIELGTNEDEIEHMANAIEAMDMERTVKIISELIIMHRDDCNFSGELLQNMEYFVANPSITENPEKYPEIVQAMKVEAVLATENSPYAEVRANVDPTDDPSMPASTVRAWFIGIIFAAIGSFIDNLFAFRQPSISIGTNVAQLAAYPLGKFFAAVLPDWRFRFFGEHSINPGPFNRKEHMLISIMANISFTAPYTFYIIPVQAMPRYFNESFAFNKGYQILISLAVGLFGYGLAGLLRRFLVYPSVAIWPATLNTVALVKAFHMETNEPVPGPFGRIYRASREKIFLVGTVGMGIYFFLPGYLFQAMSVFSWMTWIAPENVVLDAVTGIYGGLGLNPWPTFDFNMSYTQGLLLPTFALANQCVGIVIAALVMLACWYTNAWNTGYLPINSNGSFDNQGNGFDVTKILGPDGKFSEANYQAYSQPWFSVGYIIYNLFAFASYTSAICYVAIFHRHDIKRGFRGVWRKIFNKVEDEDLEEDVHYRLMKVYKEVPEWWFAILLLVPICLGCAAVAGYPTGESVAPLFYGLILPIIFVLPLGIMQAVTGIPIALNILADLIGGSINAGNPNGLMYFKCWAYLSSWQALSFTNDMKLAHYLKIPPRVTFTGQILATVINAIVSALSFGFIMDLPNVCTPEAAFHFTCPSQTSFYTATIFWSVLSPKKLFGPNGNFNMMLLGFPLGVVLVLLYWFLRRRFPRSNVLRQVHPVMFCMGPVTMAAPYNLAYYIGNLYINLLSFHYIRKKYLAFWAKWNYVISAAFPCGIAISALIMFFALEIPNGGITVDWWGNNVVSLGCEGLGGCPRLEIPAKGYFGPDPGQFN